MRVDLPTFGRPTTDANPALKMSRVCLVGWLIFRLSRMHATISVTARRAGRAIVTLLGMPPTPIFRPTARLIVRDPANRILLFSSTGSDGTYWFTPGGGMKDGETIAGAAVRELAEETGYVLAETEIGPVVATCAGQWAGQAGEKFFGADSFFFVTVGGTPVDTGGQEDFERSLITGHRWWNAEELRTTSAAITPRGLPDLVAQLLTSGVPDWPVRLPWRVA